MEFREALTLPSFPSAESRDAQYASWVAEGNRLRDGMRCWVRGQLQTYRDGGWR